MTLRRIFACLLLLAAFAIAATPARAENDEVQFGSDIRVGPDSTIHDAVCFFCSVNIEGKATGDIVVFFGSVHVSGDAQHDLVNFFGSTKVADNASVDHDLVSFFSELSLGENVHIGEDLVSMFGTLDAARSVTVEGDRVVQPAWLFFGPLAVLISIVYFIVHEVREHRRRVYMRYPFPPPPPRF
jgi:predicted acyltransferase (DUF342 family)